MSDRAPNKAMNEPQDEGGCIYPGPHGVMSAEHYLPAALGKFEHYQPLYDRVCRPCNTHIGNEVETQFLRAGPIGFFRYMLGIEGRDGLPPSPFYRGAGGAPPLVMLGRAPGFLYDLLWEVEQGTENVFPLRQIVFEHPLAGAHPVPVLDSMRGRPATLIEHARKRGLESARPIHAFASAEEIPWVSELFRAVGGEARGGWSTTTFQPQRIPLVVTVTVTNAYLRAVAKITFHYLLKMFPDELTGHEREFDLIKAFIWSGEGNVNRFVGQRDDQFLVNFRRGYRPTHWMHILAVERTYTGIVTYAQFFLGPRSMPPPYEVQVGIDPARIARAREWRAHQFVIIDSTAPQGPVGVMEDLQPVNRIWVPI